VKIVDGATGVLGSVGDPIMQVRNPEVWSALFRANGANALCIPFHVSPGELPTFFCGPTYGPESARSDLHQTAQAGPRLA
jgi:shikimate 5-dehydrogenase